MKRTEMALIMAEVYLAFPMLTISEEVVTVWHRLFADEAPLAFQAAIGQAVKAKRFFPTPGEVAEIIESMRPGPKMLTADEAFTRAIEIARDSGLLRSKMRESLERADLKDQKALVEVLEKTDMYVRINRLVPRGSVWSTPVSTRDYDSTRAAFISLYKMKVESIKAQERGERARNKALQLEDLSGLRRIA